MRILRMTGCGSRRLRLRCGTNSATGFPWRQIRTVSPVASTSASRAESFVFASWMLTIFIQSSFRLFKLRSCSSVLQARMVVLRKNSTIIVTPLSLPAGIHGVSRRGWDEPPHVEMLEADAGVLAEEPVIIRAAAEYLDLRPYAGGPHCNAAPMRAERGAGGCRSKES